MLRKAVLVALAATLLLTGCGGTQQASPAPSAPPAQSPAPAAQPVGGGAQIAPLTIKFAHAGSSTHPYAVGANKFKDLVEQKSSGAIKVEIYGDAQLGSEREEVESLRIGTLHMTSVAAEGALPNWVPELQVFGLPFIIRDREHAYKVLGGPIGLDFAKKLEAQDLKHLAWWELGFRNVTTKNNPVKSPADMKGLKMRVQESKVWIEFMKSLGAIPTPIPFGELYSALQQGVVDGQENPLATIVAQKFYEVQKHVALTGHTYTSLPVMASLTWWNGLKPEQQKIIAEAALESQEYQRKTIAGQEADGIKFLKEKGVTVSEVDKAAFAEATKEVSKAIADKVPAELVQKIRDTK